MLRGDWHRTCKPDPPAVPAHVPFLDTTNGVVIMSLLWTALIGLIAGALAKAIMPGRDPGGIIITMLLGVAGAMLGTFLGRAVGWYQPGEGAGLIAAIVGAMRGRSATV
jgi:uncharacterized membrane protein YeaQ/YmgE (transglycosylase-associated protein family)